MIKKKFLKIQIYKASLRFKKEMLSTINQKKKQISHNFKN